MQRVRGEHSKLVIRDLSSKHGVYIDKKRIEPARDIEVMLDNSNLWITQESRHIAGRGYGGFVQVRIGEKTSFRLERVDWSLCSQGLTAQTKVGIVGTAAEIDCKVEDSWVPGVSTHLVVGKSNRSDKLYLALAEGAYLVDVAWLKAVESSFKDSWHSKGQKDARSLEAEHAAHVPAAFEHSNIQWTPNYARRKLFKDYRFISIVPAKHQSLGQLISCAGGEWTITDAAASLKLINECLVATLIPVFLLPHSQDNVAKTYSKLDAILKKMKYRWVREDEIGMAIIYASTEIYCNPKYVDPLPTLEVMATLQNSQFPASVYRSSVALASPTLSRTGSNTEGSKDSPQVVDDDTESNMASLSLSELMPLPRKQNRATSIVAKVQESVIPTPPRAVIVADKPPKKKVRILAMVYAPTKTDRMAMFFDGLDEDEDIIRSGLTKNDRRAELSSSSVSVTSLSASIPAAWPEKLDLTNEEEKVDANLVKVGTIVEDAQDSQVRAPLKDTAAVDERIKSADHSMVVLDVKDEPISPTSSFVVSSTGPKKKVTVFDGVREDMVALKLDVKLGRQKDNLDEKERLRRLEIQRLEDKLKDNTSKFMQSEWSESLLAKGKRRKMDEGKDVGSSNSSQVSIQLDQSASVQILTETDQKDWPGRWKNVPNFKSKTEVDTVLQEKWKNVPNYKAFRKSAMTGVHLQGRRPMALALDGEISVKHEETAHKIGHYLKRESQEPSIPSPAPRRKKGEAQMTRDDIKALLEDD
ncbi:hypothetical protein EDD11_009872 [Mortierella claussenii]|nr:hypothetical protein EDD11_009872 [Mortierella claussenii]